MSRPWITLATVLDSPCGRRGLPFPGQLGSRLRAARSLPGNRERLTTHKQLADCWLHHISI